MAHRMFILAIVGAALVIAPVSDAKNKSRAKPRKSDGNYTLTVAGFYGGSGKAVVSSGSVQLSLTVAPESGGKGGSVNVTLSLTGNRFSGDSKFNGQALHLEGRLDAPDDERERTLRGVRLICRMRVDTQTSAGLAYSSVVGFVPELANTPDEIDTGGKPEKQDGDDKNNGKGNG